MNDEKDIILTKDDQGVRTITLNRPDVLNAFNEAILVALLEALRAAEEDETVRCIVITGAGRGVYALGKLLRVPS